MRGLWFDRTGTLDALVAREDLPTPRPGPGEVRVRVRAAGVNPSDPKGVLGRMAEVRTPRVPGRDLAGVVEEGAGAPEWVGRRVVASGGGLGFGRDGSHAEQVVVPVELLVELPPALSFAQGAALGVPFVTAALMVRAAAIRRDETVLVIGASGSVGRAAAQLARRSGARVLGLRRTAKAAPGVAVDAWLDPALPLAESVRAETGGRGADAILDGVGGQVFERAVTALARRGRYVAIASAPPRVSFDLVEFYHREAHLVGVDSLKIGAPESAAVLREVAASMAAGTLAAPEVQVRPLSEFREAYAAALGGGHAKQVLEP